MPNHIHLIAVPDEEDSLSRALGQTHSEYALAFNRREAGAIPLLTGLATRSASAREVVIFSIQSIGEIDADGNKTVLLGALKHREFSVRRTAAEALSKTNDPSVLTELEVAASQEDHLDQSRVIQALADSMRARMNAVVK